MKGLGVMITGLGGPVGVSILKALRMSELNCKIVGTDIDPFSVGLYMADQVCMLPDARQEPQYYLEKIIDTCRELDVKILFTGSEAELRLLSENKDVVEKQTGTVLMVNKPEITNIACDKWKTVQFLQSYGIAVPESVLAGNWQEINDLIRQKGFPLIVKPRISSGSQGVFKVHNKRELKAALTFDKNAVIQEYLEAPDQEYTVGVFMRDAGQYLGSIAFRRWLGAGLTYKAIVVKNPEIERLSREAAIALGAIGPVNVQLKFTEKGSVIFEINPRISSSAVMRAKFGFNEPELAIRSFVLGENVLPPEIKQGIALRYWEELYI